MGNLFAYDSPLWRGMNRAVQFLWLSILWGACCLPIFTIGASTTALYAVTLKCVKNQESYLTPSFFRSFKQNLKQATIIWARSLCLGMFLGVGLLYYFRLEVSGTFFVIVTTAFFSLFVSYLLTNLFVYPLLAVFDNTTKRTLINAVIMALTHLPSGILMLSLSLIILVVGALLFPPLLFVAPALTAYINSRFLTKIFDPYVAHASAACGEAAL
ncbi:YesL family protein [Lacrimispora brassicae]